VAHRDFPHVFEPVRLGGLTLKNRIFVRGHTTNYGVDHLPSVVFSTQGSSFELMLMKYQAPARDDAIRSASGRLRSSSAIECNLPRSTGSRTPSAAPRPASAVAAYPGAAKIEDVPAAAEAEAVEVAAAESEEEEEIGGYEDPWIDSPLCSTCNDCLAINPLLFVYDESNQAFIADLSAGTYAQMVEAAEICPTKCIHPGKPWDPNEPNLDELIKRAEPFNH